MISFTQLNRSSWQGTTIASLAFWLCSSLTLDFVLMPGMYAAGMMNEPGFATAGYSMFWLFNRFELICAALILTGTLVMAQAELIQSRRMTIALAATLMVIVLACTYALVPEMSALGLQLDPFSTVPSVPAEMNLMHGLYWLLDLLKLVAGGVLLRQLLIPAGPQ
jgi:Domain of unknown function (DUF4149)